MSGKSSNAAEWFSLLEPGPRVDVVVTRPDDPRLGEIIERWNGDVAALQPGRGVIVGFPQDEGVRRNHGRAGAAEAPNRIRHWLHRLTAADAQHDIDLTARPPLDAGNVRIAGDLEASQQALGQIIAGLLAARAVPIVLGGGHETAFGHYLGLAAEQRRVGIINLDAHLDVRPLSAGQGHSGTPFRQALEFVPQPLFRYVCLGAQPGSVSRAHRSYVHERNGVIVFAAELRSCLPDRFAQACEELVHDQCQIYVSVDADVVRCADVPGVSAPNPCGLAGEDVIRCARSAGASPAIVSFDLVEINPRVDRDDQSSRWAALAVWNFLVGLMQRP